MRKVARSSITGRFVSWWTALRHPDTTQVETVDKPPPTGKRKRKR